MLPQIVPEPIWMGKFVIKGNQTDYRDELHGNLSTKASSNVLEVVKNWDSILLELQGYLSTNASLNVLEVVKNWDSILLLDEVPRTSTWPVKFEDAGAIEDDIGIYFIAQSFESYNRGYTKLLTTMMEEDLALKGNFGGADLLIFPSSHLPQKAQRWNTIDYLWGVFKVNKEGIVDPKAKTLHVVKVQPSVEDCNINHFNAEQYSPTPNTIMRISPFSDLVILEKTVNEEEENMLRCTDLSFLSPSLLLSRVLRLCPSLLSDPCWPQCPALNRVKCSQSAPPVDNCSFYGDKVNPEPVRSSRTEGKTRSAEDTYGDSKSCEKDMHRGLKLPKMHMEPLQTTVSAHSSLSSTVTVKGVPFQNIDKGQTDNNNSNPSIGDAGQIQNVREWSG